VVDDDAAVRATVERLLLAEGYAVTTAPDGLTALERFRDDPPDLVLLDVIMPGTHGFEVCRRLKADPASRLVPVVLLSGLGSTEDRVRGIDAGADEFLSKPFDAGELIARVRALLRTKGYVEELERAETVLFALARAVERRDADTEDHCERIAEIGVRLGRRLGLPEEDLIAIRRAGYLHDIGKVAVPDTILLKPAPLTTDEWEVMRRHPVTGEEICSGLRSFRDVLPIIRHHHERMDGSGYPDGLRGDAIPLPARILSIVDVFDALTVARPYRRPLGRHQAIEAMRVEVRRGWWDPHVFEQFTTLLAVEDGPRGRRTSGPAGRGRPGGVPSPGSRKARATPPGGLR